MEKRNYIRPGIRIRRIETENFIAQSDKMVTFDVRNSEEASEEMEHWAKGNTITGENITSDANGRNLWEE